MAPRCTSALFAQCLAHPLPESSIPPAAKLLMDGFPRWKINGQLTPLAARLHHVKQGVDDAPQLMFARTTTGMSLAALLPQQRLQTRPLSISQITRVHNPNVKSDPS